MEFDLRYYLNNDINTKMDRSAMFHSVETRSPFMDYRLVNFAKSIPFEFLYDGTSGKKILKDLLFDKLPVDLFDRPKKGFSVPIKNWFRNEMKDYVLDLVTKNNLNRIPIIDTDKMLKLRDRHLNGKIDDSKIIFSIISYINWLNFNKL
jgi:asparagine synthase (glutamine-hydrolysing)